MTFDEILAKGAREGKVPARTDAARSWYRNLGKEAQVKENDLVHDKSRVKKKIEPGSMFLFQYDPKTKEELPYYDRFPMIFPVDVAPGGFYGINLHYLPLRLRARLMDALYKYVTDDRYDTKTKLAITYKVLQGASKLKLFKPCLKRYLYNHVQSPFVYIFPSEWDTVLWMDLQRFAKKSDKYVWDQSTKMVYG